ncbi:MAG: SOS response-associated peptidase [Trueperaceae bacterium]|nr:SOS response-associated peptidase [Trueperaceae bacterium]
MCGRYTLYHDEQDLTELFELDAFAWAPRYNIAPTQTVPIVREGPAGRQRLDARWGLVPAWVKDVSSFRALLFNARAETVGEKPAFRDAARRARCVLPASGFYEWRSEGDGKQPYYVRRRDGAPMALAGLYAERAAGEPSRSATVLTTEPNTLLAELHDRMPVILERHALARWLDREAHDVFELDDLLRPCASELLEAYPVDRAVGNARIDEARLVQRV